MSDLLDWLQLALLPIPRKQKQSLLKSGLTPEATLHLDETQRLLRQCCVKKQIELPRPATLLAEARCISDRIEELGWQILTPDMPHFPQLLHQIPDPPTLLYAKGELSALEGAQIAVVGSRKASPLGVKLAQRFAKHLSDWGLGVVSGLALGIDAAAHQGALQGGTATSAVLANGAGTIYPRSNRRLADHILAEGGVILTENPPAHRLEAWHFPERNRLISGLSLGTLVVEADLKSGSLITAQLALSQGREVFAIPGALTNPQARGCHQLIKQGAVLVDSPEDILNSLHRELRDLCPKQTEIQNSPARVDDPLMQILGATDLNLNELAEVTGSELGQLQVELARLELSGAITRRAGRYFRNG